MITVTHLSTVFMISTLTPFVNESGGIFKFSFQRFFLLLLLCANFEHLRFTRCDPASWPKRNLSGLIHTFKMMPYLFVCTLSLLLLAVRQGNAASVSISPVSYIANEHSQVCLSDGYFCSFFFRASRQSKNRRRERDSRRSIFFLIYS